MASYEDKSNTAHIDAIDNVSSDSVPSSGNVDDKIIYDLEHHGEEVGITFRTFMAACVRALQAL
jgi:hypothetical protein